MIPSDRDAWRNLAACRGCDPELFFPDRGGPSAALAAQAKAICASCPSRVPCLEEAIRDNEEFGVRGGLTPRERRRLRRDRGLTPAWAPKEQPIRHGTTGGYLAHRRRGEIPCDECRLAASADRANRRDAKVALHVVREVAS